MNRNAKKELVNTFIDAGIAFYLDGDWRNVFSLSKTHKHWGNKTDKEFQKALNIFFNI